MSMGRINEPLQTADDTLLVASLEDLLAMKLKAILDRAEVRDYRDIAAVLSSGVSIERALGVFTKMYGKDPGLPLRAIGYFIDGELPTLANSGQNILRGARDRVSNISDVSIANSLAGAACLA
jgi:nucleotidyltransferase AbiEii toxin of type IV toxin-antitoxin system